MDFLDVSKSLQQSPRSPLTPLETRPSVHIPKRQPRGRLLSTDEYKTLTRQRVIQRNLVYIINLSSKYAESRLLEQEELFGQYGKIVKCLVNKDKPHKKPGIGFTFSAHITYSTEIEAAVCIRATNDFELDGKRLQVTYGTTKYCNNFLIKGSCSKTYCAYLHEYGEERNSIYKDQVLHQKHIEPTNSVLKDLEVIINEPVGEYKLPQATLKQEKQCFLPAQTPGRIGRFYSYDSLSIQSRFDFANQTTDDSDSPTELLHPPSPLKNNVEIQAREFKRILDCAPWIKDICTVYQQNQKIDERRLSCGVEDEDTLMVTPK